MRHTLCAAGKSSIDSATQAGRRVEQGSGALRPRGLESGVGRAGASSTR